MAQISLAQTRSHGGNLWELRRQRRGSKNQILDFSVDINPLGFPAVVRAVILEHLDEIRYYPDPDACEFRDAIAAHHRVPVETILPGNGAAELISLLARVRQANKVLIIVPTFGEYEWAMNQVGATILPVHTTEASGFHLEMTQHDWPQLLDGVDLVFLCNPNNPTGVAIPKDAVLELARRCREAGAWLIVDEAFVEFVEQPDAMSVVSDASRQEHLIVLRSLTKLFAIPGLRLGYVVASPLIVERLRALQPAWPLNTFALAVGAEVLQQFDYVARSRRLVIERRDELTRLLGTLPHLRPLPSVTNFLLCKLMDAEITSSALCDQLAGQGLLLRNCDSFTGLEPGRFIRVAVRTQEENLQLVSVLHKVLNHAHSTSLRAMVSERSESNHAR